MQTHTAALTPTTGASQACPLCKAPATLFCSLDDVPYFDCRECDFIFAHPAFLRQTDQGDGPREYDPPYWEMETQAARERSFGPSLARFAEAALYCRIPIKRCIDIGTGPGFLLEALQHQLPSACHRFFGVEKFPPAARPKLRHPKNYVVGSVGKMPGKFEMGTCIEVLEHLTPAMARDLARQLRKVSVPGSLFFFNTGLAHWVRSGEVDYLDPIRRGHITSWSVKAARSVFGPEGFTVQPIEGKDWAFVVEFGEAPDGVVERIWNSPNAGLLKDEVTGSTMHLLGIESARSYAAEARWRLKH
jgi:hypothetical protein